LAERDARKGKRKEMMSLFSAKRKKRGKAGSAFVTTLRSRRKNASWENGRSEKKGGEKEDHSCRLIEKEKEGGPPSCSLKKEKKAGLLAHREGG